MYLSTALLSMPARFARLANGHGPLGRLPVGFRAKSAIFLAGAQKSCFSRCDAGALAVGELVSRTDKGSNLATDEDSNWLRKIISKEIAVAIRSGAVLIRSSAVLICTPPCGYS